MEVLFTIAMRFSSFVSNFFMASLTCESWIRLQTIKGLLLTALLVDGVWLVPVLEPKAPLNETVRRIATRKGYFDCILNEISCCSEHQK